MPTYAHNNNNNNSSQMDQPTTSRGCIAAAGAKLPASPTCLRRKEAAMDGDCKPAARGASTGRNSFSSQGSGDDASRSLLSSNADYDHIRNTTLMFFLDRLYMFSKDGKEARSLHDLSCLFGTKEFTKEMRHIVGNSRNGLKKFLQSYPSLFTLDGDQVYLTQLKVDAAAPVRDYNKEAVEYFTKKLLQFGTSLVPIRNLFGYRSQASQEVRHVSGKNTKEFKQFLGAHPDVFEILADEHVVLKSALQELESRGESYLASLQQQTTLPASEMTVIDPYLNKQFAHFIEDCMRRMCQVKEATEASLQQQQSEQQSPKQQTEEAVAATHRVTMEYLHETILKECNNQLFLKMVKTIEDLKMFLRMHPKIFKRIRCDQDQIDYVSLITDEERKEIELTGYSSLMSRQHSTLKRTATNESNLSDYSSDCCQQPMSLPPTLLAANKLEEARHKKQSLVGSHHHNQQQQQQQQEKQINRNDAENNNIKFESNNNSAKATSSCNSNSASSNNNNSKSVHNISAADSSSNSKNGGRSSLRATAPPFVPSTHLSQQQAKRLPLQVSNSSRLNHADSSSYASAPMQRSVSNLGPTTLNDIRQRGAVKDPRQALRSYLLKASAVNSASGLYSPEKLSNGAQHKPPPAMSRQTSNLVSSEELRTRTVSIVREASNIVTRIMTEADAIAFDCKGYNLGFDGQITLIQFAFLPKLGNTKSGSKSELSMDTIKSSQQQQTTTTNSSSDNNNKQKPEVCIFDLITNPELAYCLKPLLESEQVVKIVHDVRNKSNALFSQFGIMLNHVFDTQVANLVIQQQETGKPAYKSRYISMSRLCEIYGDESLTKYRNLIKSKTRHSGSQNNCNNTNSSKVKDVNYWKTRPLTDAMVYESTMDVYCLVGGVYQNLKSRIIPEYQPLFEQLNLEGVLARIKPDEIRSVKKERKIDLEVIDLKRKLYSDTTSSIVLSNREIRLLRHIDLSEEVRQKIQQCKKVAKKLERLDMKAAQLQQSMASQVSSDADHNTTLDSRSMDPNTSVQTNGSSSSSCGKISLSVNNNVTKTSTNSTNTTTTDQKAQPEVADSNESAISEGLFNEKGEFDETKMENLMNSSMFDELKDKMIESSSLLEYLDDEDENDLASGELHSSYHKHSGNHEDCRCQCHRGSSHEGEKSNHPSLKSSLSSNSCSTDQEDASVGSKSVDMAIQCDLLN